MRVLYILWQLHGEQPGPNQSGEPGSTIHAGGDDWNELEWQAETCSEHQNVLLDFSHNVNPNMNKKKSLLLTRFINVILFIKQHKTENFKENECVKLILGTVCVTAAASPSPSITFLMTVSNTYKKLGNGKHNSF